MIIYAFKNKVNNKIYVGQTCRTFEERMGEHLRHKNTTLGKALDKYGVDNFEYGVVDEAETIEELNEKEIFWIKKLNSKDTHISRVCKGKRKRTGGFKWEYI